MQVNIYNHYSKIKKTLSGPPAQIEFELKRLYPWLHKAPGGKDVRSLVDWLNQGQAYEAEVVDQESPEPIVKSEPRNLDSENDVVLAMLGHNQNLHDALDAAQFLSGPQPPAIDRVRRALWEADGDVEEAALLAYGLEASEANLKALRGVQSVRRLHKGQLEPAQASSVEAGHPDADQTADEVRRAFQDEFVMPVELGGRHSQGSLLARDQDSGNVWLLKPGAGGPGPAAGAREEQASQSRREAAFFHLAEEWHLGQFLPHSDLLIIDGREYAAIRLLPWSYKTMDKIKRQDPQRVRNVLHDYQNRGLLHQWAVLDFVLGNPDRHAQNLMVKDEDVKLIDHGSAMAGEAFDPAHDRNSFTPFYLRAWASGKFSVMDAQAKLKTMPRLGRDAEQRVRAWFDGLHGEDLDKVLLRYGVNPAPARERLAKLKAMSVSMPIDEAINKVWVET
jgi:hypothetical protein